MIDILYLLLADSDCSILPKILCIIDNGSNDLYFKGLTLQNSVVNNKHVSLSNITKLKNHREDTYSNS